MNTIDGRYIKIKTLHILIFIVKNALKNTILCVQCGCGHYCRIVTILSMILANDNMMLLPFKVPKKSYYPSHRTFCIFKAVFISEQAK